MTTALKFALFGAGNIGERHLRLAKEEPQCAVVAIADPAPHGARLANEFGAQHYATAEALLEHEAELDGAIIATPNDQHANIGIACIQRGLPVLVEKPVTDTLASGQALVDASTAHDVPIAVGHHRRFDPSIDVAKETLDNGTIGRPVAVECLWSMRKHDTYFDADWRRNPPSGGPALINLIHDIDLLRYLLGDIVRLSADGGAVARDNAVEDTLALHVRFASGAVGTILASDAAPSPWGWELGTGENPEIPPTGRNCYRFMGTAGSLALPRLELWRHREDEPADWHHQIEMRPLADGARAALRNQLTHFCGVVRGESAPRVDGADGLQTLRTVLAIHESLAQQKAVDL